MHACVVLFKSLLSHLVSALDAPQPPTEPQFAFNPMMCQPPRSKEKCPPLLLGSALTPKYQKKLAAVVLLEGHVPPKRSVPVWYSWFPATGNIMELNTPQLGV